MYLTDTYVSMYLTNTYVSDTNVSYRYICISQIHISNYVCIRGETDGELKSCPHWSSNPLLSNPLQVAAILLSELKSALTSLIP